MSTDTPRCKDCIYWEHATSYQDWGGIKSEGNCHRNPPELVEAGEVDYYYRFPEVRSTDWCGEWRNTRKTQ